MRTDSQKRNRDGAHILKGGFRLFMAAACLSCAFSCLREDLFQSPDLTIDLVVNMAGETAGTRPAGESSMARAGETATKVGETATRAGKTTTRSDEKENGRGDEAGTEAQRKLNDVYALIFDKKGSKLLYVAKMSRVMGKDTAPTQVYSTSLDLGGEPIDVTMWVLANVEQNGLSEDELKSLLTKSKEEVRQQLIFNYNYSSDENGQTLSGWDITEHCLPMWGEAYVSADSPTISLNPENHSSVYVSSKLYRAVAKMGFSINLTKNQGNDGDTEPEGSFTLKEVYVYYANKQGSVTPAGDAEPDGTEQYTTPNVPPSSDKFSIDRPIRYKVNGEDGIGDGGQWFDHIILCESDNKADNKADEKKLTVVVGGTHAPLGESDKEEISYYRIDMATDNGPFDIVRNHSYIFNITGVTAVGTSDPDPGRATDGLVVEIMDYTEEDMKGVDYGNSLTVSRDSFSFSSESSQEYTLDIAAAGIDWEWEFGRRRVYYEVNDALYYVLDNNGNNPTMYYAENGTIVNSKRVESEENGSLIYYTYSDDDGMHETLVNWLSIAEDPSNTTTRGRLTFSAKPVDENASARKAHIYITAGTAVKKIRFEQGVDRATMELYSDPETTEQ